MTSFQTIVFHHSLIENRSYSVYILKLIGPVGTRRWYSFVHFETDGAKGTKSIVSDLVNILKMTLRFVQCVQFETDGNKGTKSIVSDLVNILKMIGLENIYNIYNISIRN